MVVPPMIKFARAFAAGHNPISDSGTLNSGESALNVVKAIQNILENNGHLSASDRAAMEAVVARAREARLI